MGETRRGDLEKDQQRQKEAANPRDGKREVGRVGPGQWVTWIVVLYSSKVLARLSAWRVRWESPKLTETGPSPPKTLRLGVGGTGGVGLGEELGPEGEHQFPGNHSDLSWLIIQGLQPSRTSLCRLGAGDTQKANVFPQPPHLGEDGVSLANEAFTLVELPLPRKEPVHLSGLPSLACPLSRAPLLNLPPCLWTSATPRGVSAELPTGPGNLAA